MPEPELSEARQEYIKNAALSTARVLANASDEEIDILLAVEMLPFNGVEAGLKMVAEDRGWTETQIWKGVLYAVLRQRRAAQESAGM
jgi:hypothetical protein